MTSISDLVQEILAAGYLSLTAEEQLRALLKSKYSLEDMKAFMKLQREAMNGRIKQESRELRLYQQESH